MKRQSVTTKETICHHQRDNLSPVKRQIVSFHIKKNIKKNIKNIYKKDEN